MDSSSNSKLNNNKILISDSDSSSSNDSDDQEADDSSKNSTQREKQTSLEECNEDYDDERDMQRCEADLDDGDDQEDEFSHALQKKGSTNLDLSKLGKSDQIDNIAASNVHEKQRRRSNAKAVECIDEFGNVVAKYRSGTEAAHAMGVLHGDISMACRGLKDNIKGFRFRFEGEEWQKRLDRITKKRQAFVEPVIDIDERLSTRLSKFRTEKVSSIFNAKSAVFPDAEIKVC